MADFGERVDLTANLASILRRYPFGIGLFREIIQNSDDAKATKQIFVLDHREYPSESLLRPKLDHLQGPALLAYNDTVFSVADWEAIRTVSQSSKSSDSEKIGKHGLGSRAYYHLTDNPQYLSGGHIAIFDPHRWVFENGGWKEELGNVASHYQDQLAPFRSIVGEDMDNYFPGTVVRLALRAATSQSRISTDRPSAEKIHNLLIDFVKQELHFVLLFLSHLTVIEIREIDRQGREVILATATATSQPRQLSRNSDPSATFVLSDRTISVSYHPDVRSDVRIASCDWLVIRASFPIDECIDLLADALHDSRKHAETELKREKLRPDIALAFPATAAQDLNGRLFTFLPLPLETGFPCHIHGVFSLTDSRQNLRNPSETIMPGTADAVAVAWNKLLFDTFVPRVWLALLETIASGRASLELYDILPPLQDRRTSGDAQYWTSLLRDVVGLALERDAPVWPELSGSTSTSSNTYTRLINALVASWNDKSEHLEMLVKAGIVVIRPPSHVNEVLLESRSQHKLTPENVRPQLSQAGAHLAKMSRSECNLVIEFLLQTRALQHLVDVPVIPLVSDGMIALAAKQAKTVHVLLSDVDAELFGCFDASAIALQTLPLSARTLLVNEGSRLLNVTPLTRAKATEYVQAACQELKEKRTTISWVTTWSWDRTCEWLALFWEWVGSCGFTRELLTAVNSLPLLPTTAEELRSLNDPVFFYPLDLDDSCRDLLSRLGIYFLHHSTPPAFFEQHRPQVLKSASSASELLNVLLIGQLDLSSANVLRTHLSTCLTMRVFLTDSQKATLRALPIHLVAVPNPITGTGTIQPSSIPRNAIIHCLLDPEQLVLPLPSIENVVFVHRSPEEQRLLEHIDYAATVNVLSETCLLQLLVDNIEQQSSTTRVRVLQFIAQRREFATSPIMEKLRASSIVPVGNGTRLAPPKDVVDPSSPIANIVPRGDPNTIFDVNSGLIAVLVELQLLRQQLDSGYVAARIRFIANYRDVSVALEAARGLLYIWDATWFGCAGLQYDAELAWIPTREGLRKPLDTRDAKSRLLCDRVMPLLAMEKPLKNKNLRRLLGWLDPIPLDTLIEQLRRLLAEPDGSDHHVYLFALISEFGQRALSAGQLAEIRSLLSQQRCVPTGGRALMEPSFAVFELDSRLRGFGQILLELQQNKGVKEFLVKIGCTNQPSNAAILCQLQLLGRELPSVHVVSDCVELLKALDFASLNDKRSSLLVPGVDDALHRPCDLFYNDLGSRAVRLQLPEGKVQVHRSVPPSLRGEMQIASLGSLNLTPVPFVGEDMREDLTTRISNVLGAYDIGQAFNEFLANAADAGATKVNLMLDNDPVRASEASHSTLLSNNMVQFCRGSALVVHNDAEFTEDDIRGICRIGRGGKEDQDASIGRFGLGALSFYHFTELAMILSGSFLMLLDPSGCNLPEELNRNSYVMRLEDVKRLYPGHLRLFHGLFGFQDAHCNYHGTIIRLPLRSREQASRSALSKRPLVEYEVHKMLMSYEPVATRSLFFVAVNKLAAWESGRPLPLWTTSVQRCLPIQQPGCTYTLQDLSIVQEIDGRSPVETAWRVFTAVITSASYPEWATAVTTRHRIKQVSVALAGELLTSRKSSREHFFYSSLPLPIITSLPMHVHASFVLAEDRRSVRWDGDGNLNEDSKFNQWLLSSMLPPLWFFALESWASDFPNATLPWPVHTDHPLSRAVTNTVYTDGFLLASSRQVFRSITGRLLVPSSAVIRSGIEPGVIKKVISLLRPDDLVELPARVCPKLLKTQIKQVASRYIFDLISQRPGKLFLDAYCRQDLNARDITEIVAYILGDPEVSPAKLIHLPLMPLADKTLAYFGRSGQSSVYVEPRGRHDMLPWSVFPARRFLHPEMDPKLLLEKGLNVEVLSGPAIVDLVRDVFPPADRRHVSKAQRDWIDAFWSLFRTLDKPPTLDDLASFPLVPTVEEDTFISLNKAVSLPVIGYPSFSFSTARDLVVPLQKLGAEFLRSTSLGSSNIPYQLTQRLQAVSFDLKRVMEFFAHVDSHGCIDQRFGALMNQERAQLAGWVRENIKRLDRTQAIPLDIACKLPIWTAHHRTGPPSFRSLTDPLVRILPSGIISISQIALFLYKDSSLYYVEWVPELEKFSNVKPLSTAEFINHLRFPTHLSSNGMLSKYGVLLDSILHLLLRDRTNSCFKLMVPNQDLDLVQISSVYDSTVPEFQAAFAYRLRNFVHSQLRSYEGRLVDLGLRKALTFPNFVACVEAIHEDFESDNLEDLERCNVIFRWYNTQLLKEVDDDSLWRRLDSYAFIPRHSSRRIGGSTTFLPPDYVTVSLPFLVTPRQVLRHEHSSIAWTQRAMLPDGTDRRLLLADETLGIPSVEEVVKHLLVLAVKIAPQHSNDPELLKDIKATYEYLNERSVEAKSYLLRHRREPLFLNVNNPSSERWQFCSASRIMFNVPDEDERQDVRSFLRPFRKLLLASGAGEIKIPTAPAVSLTPAEDELARLRASFDGLRQSQLLTDVVFMLKVDSGHGDRDGAYAHRVILATASEYFHNMFCGDLEESGPASAQQPIVIRLQTEVELQCARLIIDYVYTGHFQQDQNRETLLSLLQLSHRWEMSKVQEQAERLLVATITPGTFLELRDYAQEVGATLLLEKVEEFSRENAFVLDEMIEWDALDDIAAIQLASGVFAQHRT